MQIILKLTTACNLACSYCSEGDQKLKQLPTKVFYKLVDDIPEFCRTTGEKNIEFLFHGGEPMLYGREALHSLTDYARKHLPNLNLKFLMQTNGTLIDDIWIKFLHQENICPGVSLDGYPEIHDKYRRTKDGEPTSALILQNIHALREAGLNVGTLMVLNSAEPVDAAKLFDFIRQENLHPKIHPVINCGRANGRTDSVMVYKNYLRLMKELCELSLINNETDVIQPLDEMLNAILGLEPLRECSFNGSCGRNFICLYPDGDMGFCGRDNAARFLVYGNISKKSLLELYQGRNAQSIRARQVYLQENDCQGCAEWELCHGGCAFEAINHTGRLTAKYEHCAERREFIHWLRTKGLMLLKEALVREKTKRRQELQLKKQLLTEIRKMKFSEVKSFAESNAP